MQIMYVYKMLSSTTGSRHLKMKAINKDKKKREMIENNQLETNKGFIFYC